MGRELLALRLDRRIVDRRGDGVGEHEEDRERQQGGQQGRHQRDGDREIDPEIFALPRIDSAPDLWIVARRRRADPLGRSEEHTSELQSLLRISYAVFCLKKKSNLSSHISFTTLLNT